VSFHVSMCPHLGVFDPRCLNPSATPRNGLYHPLRRKPLSGEPLWLALSEALLGPLLAAYGGRFPAAFRPPLLAPGGAM
jgi:hypothetical protein